MQIAPCTSPAESRNGSTWQAYEPFFHSTGNVTGSPDTARKCAAIGVKDWSFVSKYSESVMPTIWLGFRPSRASPDPSARVNRRFLSTVHNTAGSCSISTRNRASLSRARSSERFLSIASAICPPTDDRNSKSRCV